MHLHNIVLSTESQDRFQHMLDGYIEQFQPEGEVELGLVEQMVSTKWRHVRFLGIETSLLDAEVDRQAKEFDTLDPTACLAAAFQTLANQSRALSLLMRYETNLTRGYDKAFRQLRVLQAARNARKEAEPRKIIVQWLDPEFNQPEIRNKPNSPVGHPPGLPPIPWSQPVLNQTNPALPNQTKPIRHFSTLPNRTNPIRPLTTPPGLPPTPWSAPVPNQTNPALTYQRTAPRGPGRQQTARETL